VRCGELRRPVGTVPTVIARCLRAGVNQVPPHADVAPRKLVLQRVDEPFIFRGRRHSIHSPCF